MSFGTAFEIRCGNDEEELIGEELREELSEELRRQVVDVD